jgi:hypothetical protein
MGREQRVADLGPRIQDDAPSRQPVTRPAPRSAERCCETPPRVTRRSAPGRRLRKWGAVTGDAARLVRAPVVCRCNPPDRSGRHGHADSSRARP